MGAVLVVAKEIGIAFEVGAEEGGEVEGEVEGEGEEGGVEMGVGVKGGIITRVAELAMLISHNDCNGYYVQ